MADAEHPTPDDAPAAGHAAPAADLAPREAYRAALRAYDGAWLAALARAVGLTDVPSGRAALAAGIVDRLGEPRSLDRVSAGLPLGARLALTLMAVTETATWPARGLRHALAALGVDAAEAVRPLVEKGLVAVDLGGGPGSAVRDPVGALETAEGIGATLHAHPAAVASARSTRPEGAGPPRCGPVRQAREADGLEPVVRLAAVWQRVADAPLRQTQQGTLYKRDRDRLEDDPVLAGPIADAFEPIPDMPAFWVDLTQGVGLLESEPGSERIAAARPTFWPDNAIHLPRMIALRWLALRTWHELGGMQREGATEALALPYVRPAVLLWLATLGDDEWVTLDDLAAFLHGLSPRWAAASFLELGAAAATTTPAAGPRRPKGGRGRARDGAPEESTDCTVLAAMLLGAGYQIGLIRAAEEAATGRRAVQLTPLGRYLLALGPPPPPRAGFEHFLFVQPSFEVIAYRQGLSPALVGLFSRFTVWSQVGAALAMRLTPESVYRGLEGGLEPEAMLELLARPSARPIPAGVSEAVRTWAGRRDRVTFHAAATLVEFASAADLDEALRLWPGGPGPGPVRVSERLLLVEDESVIPWGRFRMTGSRNYRSPVEACVEVEPDGVTLTLDLARSDLLVDAELARFADEVPPDRGGRTGSGQGPAATRRRFVVSSESLARAEASGLPAAALGPWFVRRTGADLPPSVRLLLAARGPKPPPLKAGRPLVVYAPSAELLDGLAQHPATRDLLGPRLGPTAVVIPDAALAAFRLALDGLGLALDDPPGPGRAVPPVADPLATRGKGR